MNQRNTCDRCGTEFVSYGNRKFIQPCDYCRQSDFDEAAKGLQGSDPQYDWKLSEAKRKYLHLS